MSYFVDNFAQLEKRWSQFGQLLIKTKTAQLEIKQTSEGATAFYKKLALHSQYRPYTEAQRWLAKELKPACNAAIFCGLGLGYAIKVFRKLRPNADILVVELDLALFKALLSVNDYGSIFKDKKLSLCWQKKHIERYLPALQGKRLQLFCLPYLADRTDYRQLQQQIQLFVRQDTMQQNTLRHFGKLWKKNIAANLEILSASADAGQPFAQLAGLPAILLAAGSSLTDYLEYLPQLQQRFLVLCVDTVLPVLQQLKVQADIVFSVDPQITNSFHLQPSGSSNSLLIADPCCHPSVPRLAWRQRFFAASAVPLMRQLQQKFNHPRTMLASGGTVTTFAWDWARQCQLKPLVLIGCDFAFSGQRSHCSATLSQLKPLQKSERFSPCEQQYWQQTHPSDLCLCKNGEENINSTQQLRIYAEWFEQQLERTGYQCWQLCGEQNRAPALASCKTVSITEALEFPIRRQHFEHQLKQLVQLEQPARHYPKLLARQLLENA